MKFKLTNNRKIKGFLTRMFILITLILTAVISHKVFSYFHMGEVGALLFIFVFSIGVMYYYFSLFRRDSIKENNYRFESITMVLFILLLTILMYALIYSESIQDKEDYFIEQGVPKQLTFSEGLYFSVSTITTLGYGDISPFGFYRLLAMIEVLMGWIYSGSLIYFIVREIEIDERTK